MISLVQLKERFPTQNVPPYGECVIVPGTEFDPDWEAMLDEGGYGCIFTDINGKAVTLVLTIKRHGDSRKTVHMPRRIPEKEEPPTPEPTRKHLPRIKGPQWSREDENRLIKRVSELSGTIKGKCGILTKEFQGRTPNALKQKFKKLVDAGRAQPAKRGRPKKVVTRKGLEKALENVCPDCGLPEDLCCCDEEKKESLKQEPRTPLENLVPSGLMQFETYCRKCGTRRTVEDHDVWRRCPVCLEPLIIWNVEETE
jgi:hypothetical protein